MGLVVPAWGFQDYTTNLTGTPSITPGTNFTAGANNADGSSVSVLSALSHDVHLLQILIYGVAASTAQPNALLDVLIDPAGGTSWAEFIADLCCGYSLVSGAGSFNYPSLWYTFPIWIPAGASVGVRCRTRHTSNITNGRALVHAFGGPSRPDAWWCGTKVESLGINAATSSGTNLTNGNTGTYGSWTTMGTSTHPYGAVQFGYNGITDNNQTVNGTYFQIGYGSNQLPGSPTYYATQNTAEAGTHYMHGWPVWCDVPTNTTWQIRGTGNGVVNDLYSVALYGVY